MCPELSPHFLWNLNYCVLSEIFKDGSVLKEVYFQVLSFGFFFSFLSRYCTLVMRDAKQAWFRGQAPAVLQCNADLGLVPTPGLSET